MKNASLVIWLALVVSVAYGQDAVTFKSGRTITCEVQSFADGIFSMSFEGQTRFAPVGNIQSIQFAPKAAVAQNIAEPSPPVTSAPKPASVPSQKDNPDGPSFERDVQLSVHGYDTKVSTEDHADMRELKKNGMKYATVNIQVLNQTQETIGVSWGTFKLKTQDGTICEPTVWVPRIGRMDWTYVRPRDKAKGKIGFIVPIDIDMTRSFVRYDINPTLGHPESPEMYSEWTPIR